MDPIAPSPQSVSSGSQAQKGGQREKFAIDELAIVLSHYDIGTIDTITDFPRGSRKAPKLLVVSSHGKFLLKRRARGKDDPFKVAFMPRAFSFTWPPSSFRCRILIGTKKDNNSMLQWRGGVYELFEYIPGQAYPQTLEATFDSGRVLGLYHKLLENFTLRMAAADGKLSPGAVGRERACGRSFRRSSARASHKRNRRDDRVPAAKLPARRRDGRRAWLGQLAASRSFMPTGIRATCCIATITSSL